MKSVDHDRLTAQYLALSGLDPASRRRRLAGLERSDPELCAELRALLEHDDDVPRILRTGAALELIDSDPPPPARVGRYRILEEIGEGGMGIVYRAEIRDPEPRHVAIKVLRASATSGYARARFEIERRALGRMDHPNVARVIDGGMLDDGRPYVVMEHVPGEPITLFCDRHKLSIEGRLRLFLQVCQAVHHAHQRAILHRDIKPSNVLVSLVDGAPVPKVIDFGIAKPLEPIELDATLTQTGQILGTPAYMSPEQALSIGDPVDVRADVYSLGALLHELLVGSPPFDPENLRRAGPQEMRRILLDVDPPRPSARLARVNGAVREIAENRRAEPKSLARRLRGEVDWIVAKALARERADRYAAASELGADVARYLRHDPVEARPPTALYRARKLAQRHRTAAALVVTLLPLLLAFGVTMGVMARRAAIDRDRAEELSGFLVHFYEGPLLLAGRQGARKPNDVMAEGLARLERDLGNRPVLRERVRRVIGSALEGFGGARQALPELETAYARLRDLLGPDHPDTLAAADALGRSMAQLKNVQKAQVLWTQVLEGRRRSLGPKHPDTLKTLVELGNAYKMARQPDRAIEALAEARAGMIEILGWEDRATGMASSVLGAALLDAGRLDEAGSIIEEALEHLAPDHPERSFALYNLACVHARRGERDEAIASLHATIESGFAIPLYADEDLRSLFDDEEFKQLAKSSMLFNKKVRDQLASHGVALVREGDYARAETLYDAVLNALPPTIPRARFETLLSRLYILQGRFKEARPLIEKEISELRGYPGSHPEHVVPRIWLLARILSGLGENDHGLELLAEARRMLESAPGLFHRAQIAYTRACEADLRGDAAGVRRALEEAVDAGLQVDPIRLEDRPMNYLLYRPEYKSLFETARRHYYFF